MNENSLIKIASFTFPYEAQIAKCSLEAAGIPAFVADEHTINMQWLYSNAMGGVRVLVPLKFRKAAIELLEMDCSAELVGEFGEDKFSCELCGASTLVPYTKGKKPAFFIFLLFGFPLFFHKHGYKCLKCGRFSETK